jgi:hypothetical protein
MGTVFLLSPASLRGVRAQQLESPKARFAAALAYRSREGVPLAEAFTFMSGLYFRGKIAYARHFGAAGGITRVIAPGVGLVEPEWRLDRRRMTRLRRVEVDPRLDSYVRPLARDLRRLVRQNSDARFVLLGSIATGKYLDVLAPILGERLHYPRAFEGVGDMSRGAIMLRAVSSGEELDYVAYSPESGLRKTLK